LPNLADDKEKVNSVDVKPLGPVPDDDLIPLQIDEKHKASFKPNHTKQAVPFPFDNTRKFTIPAHLQNIRC
jgi:hypothetical protein